jgi:hypothetical protein
MQQCPADSASGSVSAEPAVGEVAPEEEAAPRHGCPAVGRWAALAGQTFACPGEIALAAKVATAS